MKRKMKIWSIVNIFWVLTTVIILYWLYRYENAKASVMTKPIEDGAAYFGVALAHALLMLIDWVLIIIVGVEGALRGIPIVKALRDRKEESWCFCLEWGGVGKIACAILLGVNFCLSITYLSKGIRGVWAMLLLTGGALDFIFCKRIRKTIGATE